MVKNQAFYRLGTGQAQNVWDDPIHSGTRTWKYYHGPRIRTDARLMEKLDQQDDDQERLLLEKHNVNARRVEKFSARRRMDDTVGVDDTHGRHHADVPQTDRQVGTGLHTGPTT